MSYNTPEEVVRLQGDLSKCVGSDRACLVVVDNSDRFPVESSQLSTSISGSRTSLMRPPSNLGYFGGAAYGLAEFVKSNPVPEYVAVSNADIAVLDSGFLERVRGLDLPEDCMVVAPSILSLATHSNQNPHLISRPSKLSMKLRKWIFSSYLTGLLYTILAVLKQKIAARFQRANAVEGRANSNPAPDVIYAAQGSFMIFRKKYFEAGGSFKYEPFLFGEEVFVAETVRKLGGTIRFRPEVEVHHREHVSTGVFRSRKMLRFFGEATRYCADLYFS